MAVNTAKIARLVENMVDPTKLSLIELQQELKRRGMRLNAGTFGNRMQLVRMTHSAISFVYEMILEQVMLMSTIYNVYNITYYIHILCIFALICVRTPAVGPCCYH